MFINVIISLFSPMIMDKLTIFDLDNTLLEGDSDRNWGIFLTEKNIVNQDYLNESEKFYNNYYEGSLDIDGFLKFCLKPLQDNSLEYLLELRSEYIENKIKPIVLDKAMNEVLNQKTKSEVIIATATNSFITRPIADLFEVKTLIATEFEIVDNKFTGRVTGEPCFRNGKLNKVLDWMTENNYNKMNTTFYSDSFNDLPLLKAVNTAIVVDGDEKLIMEAKKNDWQSISFR